MNEELVRGSKAFPDRRAAGRLLARALLAHAGSHPLVLALPRGGIPVADEIARALGGTLDVWIARKLGTPMHPELGMGAISEGPAVVIDRGLVRMLEITRPDLLAVARRELAEIRRRVERYRGGRRMPDIAGRTVILVDDGIATGGTMRAAIRGVKKLGPAQLIVAVPVGSPEVIASLQREVDDVVCLHEPHRLVAVGNWYVDFRQLGDDEVLRILDRAAHDARVTRTAAN
jgi:putative phosphoribosyl transferase